MQRTRVLMTVLACVAFPLAAQTPPPAQQPGLTFRVTANYVEVDAIVTDAAGEPVRDLTCADFEVSQDGKPQALSVCGFVDIPVERPDPLLFQSAKVEPDVVTNERPFDGRIFTIVLDGYHVRPARSAVVRQQALQFIDRYMGENDLAAVVHVGFPTAGQEFTNNRRLLREAVTRFAGQALPSITESTLRDALSKDAIQSGGAGALSIDPGPPTDTEAVAREFMAKESIDSLRRLAEYMGGLHGRRKAVLLFSEGIGIDFLKQQVPVSATPQGKFPGPTTDPQWVRDAQLRMAAAAAKANVSIYSIDPRGLTTGADDAPLLGVGPAPEPEGSTLRDYSNFRVMADAQEEVRRSQNLLREFAEQTGGLAMIDRNNMDEAFRRIIEDNSSYYILGYQSPDPRHDGRYHRISVKVKRPGLTVRTRKGYYAPEAKPARVGKPPDRVAELLGSPAPLSGLGMRASASVIKGLLDRSTVLLTVEFNGRDVALKSSGGLYTNEIDVEFLVLDMAGVPQANAREIAQLQLRPSTFETFADRGVRYVTEFALPPGRYQLRVAARERLGGRAGSVFYDLDVPDVATPRLAISDLLLTTSRAAETATPTSRSSFARLLPAPTTTARDFAAGDTLTAAAVVYDNDARAPHGVDLKATVMSDIGVQVFAREEHRESKGMAASAGGYPWVVEVPLRGLAPGRYVLSIEARSRLSEVDPVRRDTEFRIR